MRSRLLIFLAVFQSFLLLAHAFLYFTWTAFLPAFPGIKPVFALLAVSFLAASLLGFRYGNWAVRIFYTASAVWLGLANYIALAAAAGWLARGVLALLHRSPPPHLLGVLIFGIGAAVGVYGLINAAATRVVRVPVALPNLPEAWRGRTVAMVSDLHLGNVRNLGFIRRVVARLNRLAPEAVFIAGDLYDGTPVGLERLAQPWRQLQARLGAFFVAGNHEEFNSPQKFLDAVAGAGVRVLHNEKIELEGLQLVGVHYGAATNPQRLDAILSQAQIDPLRASVLLIHAPDHLEAAERAGISLQLSGHTHGGQFFPFTRVVARVYGRFAHGLQTLGRMQVFVSYGAGTWGPPVRVATRPEIILLQFTSSGGVPISSSDSGSVTGV